MRWNFRWASHFFVVDYFFCRTKLVLVSHSHVNCPKTWKLMITSTVRRMRAACAIRQLCIWYRLHFSGSHFTHDTDLLHFSLKLMRHFFLVELENFFSLPALIYDNLNNKPSVECIVAIFFWPHVCVCGSSFIWKTWLKNRHHFSFVNCHQKCCKLDSERAWRGSKTRKWLSISGIHFARMQ